MARNGVQFQERYGTVETLAPQIRMPRVRLPVMGPATTLAVPRKRAVIREDTALLAFSSVEDGGLPRSPQWNDFRNRKPRSSMRKIR